MDARSPAPDLLRCGSYWLGHEVHYIQSNISLREAAIPGRVTVVQDGWIAIATDDGQLRHWTHQPERVEFLIGEHGPQVLVRPHGVLAFEAVPGPNGTTARAVVSIGREPTPCPTDGPVPDTLSSEGLLDQLRSRGGFTAQITRQPGPDPEDDQP